MTKFCLGLHYNADNSYLLGNGKEISRCKASNNNNNNFPSRFCLGSISNESDCVDTEKVYFKRNLCDFCMS